MTAERSRIAYPPELLRVLELAVDAGAVAEGATRPFVQAPDIEGDNSSSIPGNISKRWRRRGMALPGPDQARRSCEHLDAFASAVSDVGSSIEDPALRDAIELAPTWSTRLWEHNRNAPDVLREVSRTAALLIRFRTQAVLGRPLSSL